MPKLIFFAICYIIYLCLHDIVHYEEEDSMTYQLTVEFTMVTPEIAEFMKVCKLEQDGNCFQKTGNLSNMLKLASHVTSLQVEPQLRDRIRMISVVPTDAK